MTRSGHAEVKKVLKHSSLHGRTKSLRTTDYKEETGPGGPRQEATEKSADGTKTVTNVGTVQEKDGAISVSDTVGAGASTNPLATAQTAHVA